MAKAKYGYEHRKARASWAVIVQRGDAVCAEAVCLMDERTIYPNDPWHVAHDPTGTIVIGVSHERCNTSEAAVRGNSMRSEGVDVASWFE